MPFKRVKRLVFGGLGVGRRRCRQAAWRGDDTVLRGAPFRSPRRSIPASCTRTHIPRAVSLASGSAPADAALHWTEVLSIPGSQSQTMVPGGDSCQRMRQA